MTEYLLDTSLIRSLNADDEQELVRRKGAISLTTSYLVPCELLSGTKLQDDPEAQKENGPRKAALGKYYKLVGFNNTYWEEELTLLCKAFGVEHSSDDASKLKQLIRDCVNAHRLEEIESPYLKEIRQTDTNIVDEFTTAFEEFREKSTSDEAQGNKIHMIYIFVLGGLIAHTHATLDPYSVSNMTLEEIVRLTEKFGQRYDGSLDLFFEFQLEYMREPRTFQRGYKRMKNDAFDLRHLLHLSNTFANYEVETGSKTGWIIPKVAICSKILANKMPSGFCGSNFIVSAAYLQPR